VRQVAANIDITAWRAIGSKAGGEFVAIP